MCGIWARLGKSSEAFPSDHWINTLIARGPEGTKVVDVTNNLINFSDNGVFSFIYPPNIDFEYMEYNGKLF